MTPRDDTYPDPRPLRVGLVNNMPDEAVSATERQFLSLLTSAWTQGPVELSLFDMPEIERDPGRRARMLRRYRPARDIADATLDALIVTGARPGAGPLSAQGFWPGFTRLIDLTVAESLPTFWSCLAAQAVTAHLDGVERRPLPRKHSGLFACTPAGPHPLLAGVDRSWRIPHSRLNDLPEGELVARGYEILTRSEAVGVDVFIKSGPPLFLFAQGHPEYDPETLLYEYRRDRKAFESGALSAPPDPPVGLEAGAPPEAEWRTFAAGLIGAWLRATVR